MFIVTKITPKIKQILTKIAGFYPLQPQSFLLAKAKWEGEKTVPGAHYYRVDFSSGTFISSSLLFSAVSVVLSREALSYPSPI